MSGIGLKHKDTLLPARRLSIVQTLLAKSRAEKERCDRSRDRSELQPVSLDRLERKISKEKNGRVTIVLVRKKPKHGIFD